MKNTNACDAPLLSASIGVHRRFRFVGGALFVAGSIVALPAVAADHYPDHPIRMIVPFPAGGPTDIVARMIALKLGDAWGEQVVVDNRGGANGIIAQDIAAKSAPDGYTLLVHSIAYVVNPMLYKVSYDNARDFTPVTLVASFPLILVVNAGVPANSVKELIALARAKPGELNYSSYGQGSIAQLAAELFKNAEQLNIVHVLYKGSPQGVAAVIANEVQMSFPSIAAVAGHINTGRLRGLAVTSRHRSAVLPNTPTMSEGGVRGFEATSWTGLFFPKGTPSAIVGQLYNETRKLVRLPDVKALLDSQAFDIVGMGPDEFRKFIQAETVKYQRVVKLSKIKVE